MQHLPLYYDAPQAIHVTPVRCVLRPGEPRAQARLGASRVAIVGCGALGTVQAEILTRAGIGLLRIIDRDVVELSNLQRQFLFSEEDSKDGTLESLPPPLAALPKLIPKWPLSRSAPI